MAQGNTATASEDSAAQFKAYTGVRALFNPLWCYHALRVAVAAITVFGVVMVYSSSSISMISLGASPLRTAINQGIYCVMGLVALLCLQYFPVKFYRRLCVVAIYGSVILQLITLTPLGIDYQGNKGWIGIPGLFTMQPAEVMKLALCIWLPRRLLEANEQYRALTSKKGKRQTNRAHSTHNNTTRSNSVQGSSFQRGASGNNWFNANSSHSSLSSGITAIQPHSLLQRIGNSPFVRSYSHVVIGFVACFGSVLLGKDLGTGLIIVGITVGAMIISGFPLKYLAFSGIGIGAVVGLLILKSPNRLLRILATYGDCSGVNAQSVCFQATHARYALASGGLFGVGLGNSREKWDYLPEAHNDFIFAIIGEELGFLGALVVIVLYLIIGWCLLSVSLTCSEKYVSLMLVCIEIWIIGQAFINILVVIGLLPVVGIPLPFISAGGSSMIMCLAAVGVALSAMRSQPQVEAYVKGSRS